MNTWSEHQQIALQDFHRLGLPNRGVESWRYFSLNFLKDFDLQAQAQSDPQVQLQIQDSVIMAESYWDLWIINGRPQMPKWNDPAIEIQTGISLFALEARAQAYLHSIAGEPPDAFERLNLAKSSEALSVKIHGNSKPQRPLRLIYYSQQNSCAYHPRVYIQVEKGSVLELCEQFLGKENDKYFVNAVSQVFLEPSSKLEYVCVQNQSLRAHQIQRTRFFLQSYATLHSLSVGLGGLSSRHNLDAYILAPQAMARVNGISVLDATQVFDHHTNVDFRVGESTATQHYKSLLRDQSKSVFNGRVHIAHGAQKASSEQLNQNLLISDQAEVDSKPQLEIHADDVKAAHGATVGQLNAEEVFYFQSRGIDKNQATQMISQGFVFELFHQLESPVLQRFVTEVTKKEKNL